MNHFDPKRLDFVIYLVLRMHQFQKYHKEKFGTKMGADSSAENTPNAPEFSCPVYLPYLSAQAQKFWISMKKGFIGRP